MKIINSDFSSEILAFFQNHVGNIFFFNHLAVVELNEGIHFDKNNCDTIIGELRRYFGSKPFGVIANRVNSYSVNLLDVPVFREQTKNLIAYGVVGHDLASKMNAEMENDFCASDDKIDFDSIYDAINNIYLKVRNHNLFSLN